MPLTHHYLEHEPDETLRLDIIELARTAAENRAHVSAV
jgi:hypothetical protein